MDKIRVPASTSNLASGFDTFGLALQKYLEVSFQESKEWQIEVEGIDVEYISRGSNNQIRHAIEFVESQKKLEPKRIDLNIKNQIPIQKGLGSSGAAIIAGLLIANQVHQLKLNYEEVLNYALELEGHPDNISAALYGGFTVNVDDHGLVTCQSIRPPENWVVVAVVPDFSIMTDQARKILPTQVSMRDAVFNIQHAALLVNAMIFNNEDQLRIAMNDSIHQPYRAQLIPGCFEVINAGRQADAIGCAISGSGSSLIAIVDDEKVNPTQVGEAMVQNFSEHGVSSRFEVLKVDIQGAQISGKEIPLGDVRIIKA